MYREHGIVLFWQH